MSLRDEVAAATRRPGGVCRVPSVAAQLTGEDRAEFDDLVADLETPATAISVALRGRQIVLGEQSISRHRRRECKCL